jgi:hypothetical protein
MRCEDVLTELQRTDAGSELAKRAAAEHLAHCTDCRNAAHALAMLRADRDMPIRVPSDDSLHRAIARATADEASVLELPRRTGTFWLGVGVGVALAASVAWGVVMLRPTLDEAPSAHVPQVTLAVNEERAVSVALSSPAALDDAEIRIALSGEIGLKGFDDQRELRWTTDLDVGVNQLTLPLIALGAGGGQVLVEIQHGEKRRVFLVDVRTTDPAARLISPGGAPNMERNRA